MQIFSSVCVITVWIQRCPILPLKAQSNSTEEKDSNTTEKTRHPSILTPYSNLGWFWKVLICSLLPKNSYGKVCPILLKKLGFQAKHRSWPR